MSSAFPGGHGPGPHQPPAQGSSGQYSGWGQPGSPGGFNAPGSPGAPGGFSAPGSPGGPGGFGGQPQPPGKKRPWALIIGAFACAGLLLLVGAVGIGIWAFTRDSGDRSAGPAPQTSSPAPSPSESPSETTPTPAEPTPFQVLSPLDDPIGDADEIWQVLESSPMTTGTLHKTGECTLPETPADHTIEQQQAVLEAAIACLSPVFATSSSDRGLPWASPTVEVYTWPDIPASPCEADSFQEDWPRMCNLDNVLYWPSGYVPAGSVPDAEIPNAYIWEVATVLMVPFDWHSSLGIYSQHLSSELESDPDRQLEAGRRHALWRACVGSAASMQVPEEARPSQAYRDYVTTASNWGAGTPPQTIDPEVRVHWIEAGFSSGGDLAACNTWAAEPDLVAG